MIRRFIAHGIFKVMRFLGKWVDKIYPEGTQRKMAIWLDEERVKVRFSLQQWEGATDLENSLGMRIPEWKSVVEQINQRLEE